MLGPSQALRFLSDAGALLAASLDREQTLSRVVRLAVPDVADWCGLYVLDDDGGERELSSGYSDPELEQLILDTRRARRERGDTSESRRVAESGEPLLASDIRAWVAEDVDERQRPLAQRLAARSYMIVPLLARGRSIGSLTMLSTREGRHYTEADLEFAQTLAGRCAQAIDNAGLFDAAERSLTLLDTIFSTMPVGLAFLDRELRPVRVNETLAAMDGLPGAEHPGRPLTDVLGELGRRLAPLCRRVLEGERLHDVALDAPASADPSEQRRLSVSATPVTSSGGDSIGVSVVVVDVTERLRLLDAEREARTRADFLARAGELLDASLDYEETLAAVADIAVPEVADWCGVSILDEDGELREVAVAHADPEMRELVRGLITRWPPDPDARTGTPQVARTGVTEVVREITDEVLEAGIADPAQVALVRRLGLRSIIIAALKARGRTLGTLALAHAESGRRFDDDDVRLAEELARRAGLSIDNARLYTARSRIAHTLQVKLLPERLPEIPGALLAARYRAAGELNEVGGDFYDVFPRSASEWALVVGDVSGKGAEAAAITALARYTLRAAALEEARPSAALARLNAAMLAHDDTSQFATAVVGYVSGDHDERMRIRLSLGGHPPPAVLRRDGGIETPGVFGTLLGMRADATMYDVDVMLEADDILLLYTDGVIEAGPRGTPFGDHGLADLLRTLAGSAPQAVVDAVEQAVVDAQPGEPRDDIALLALALRDPD